LHPVRRGVAGDFGQRHPFLPANGASNPRTYARARPTRLNPVKPARYLREQRIQPTSPRRKILLHDHKIETLAEEDHKVRLEY